MNHERFIPPLGKKVSLEKYDPGYTGKFDKEGAMKKLGGLVTELATLQDVLYAHRTFSILAIFQSLDAAGKDSDIKRIFSGVNPQGCRVVSFKQPSDLELDHDFLWRCLKELPGRGQIGVFNRSYYEEVLVVRVHQELLQAQRLPHNALPNIWKDRFEDINAVERYLVRNGTIILKFYLNVSKDEQERRFLERLERPDKNWKFSQHDLKEREYWDDYHRAYEQMLTHTSTKWAPWYIMPADNKWFTRVAIADIVVRQLQDLHLHYPKIDRVRKNELLGLVNQLTKQKK
jgi:PPK2 family polyphosphate:nucleotide phosphotransferase